MDKEKCESYLQVIECLPEEQRKPFLQDEFIKEEERWLLYMIDCNRRDDDFIDWCRRVAAGKIKEYNGYKDHAKEEYAHLITKAEEYIKLAESYKTVKYTIGDIRKQRERIQWLRKKFQRPTQTSTE